MRSGSRADGALGAAVAVVLAIGGASAQSRAGAAPSPPAWFACAGGLPSHLVPPLRRLNALNDKALVERDIASVFAQREKEQRVSPASLAKARLSIDFLYAAGDGTARQYYYEASKTIPDAGGLLRVTVSGWLRGDGGQPRSLGSKSELLWLELEDDPGDDLDLVPEPAPIPDPTASLVPLGVLATAGEHIWVMRRAVGNSPLLVYDVSPGRVRLRPAARGCRP